MQKTLTRWIVTATAGLAATLAGLGWDAAMHSRDPELAAHEGVFTLSNPSHALFVAGLAITAIGLAGALATTLSTARKLRFPFVAGALAVAMIAGGVGAWASASGDGHSHNTSAEASDEEDATAMHEHRRGHDKADVTSATREQVAAAQELLDGSIAGTIAYRDSAAAQAAGYRFAKAEMEEMKIVYHVPNPTYHHDGNILDAERPETLLYARQPGGDALVLVGVVYRMEEPGVPGPAVGGPITVWHNHSRCIDPATRTEVSKPMAGLCPEGTEMRTGPDMMHVWFTDDLATAFNGQMPPIRDLIAYQKALTN